MKKMNFFAKLVLAVCVMSVFNACEQEPQDPTPNPTPDEGNPTIGECYTITFDALPEGVVLNDGIWEGSDGEGGFSINDVWFNNFYQNTPVSQNFAVVYCSGADADGNNSSFNVEGNPCQIKSVKVNNSTYAYLALKKGQDGWNEPDDIKCKEGDWFKVIFTGVKGGNETNTVDFYLADYRNERTYICNKWTEVDLTALGEVDQVKITIEGSISNKYGLLTPSYVCIDDVVLENDTITFDELPTDITLNENGVWDGSDGKGGFSIEGLTFNNVYKDDPEWGIYFDGGFNISNNIDMKTAGVANQYSVYDTNGYSNGGFYISNKNDMQTAGWTNQYSVYNTSGANGSKNFAVVHYSTYASADGSNSSFELDKTPSRIKSVKVNNSTYAYLSLKNGDGFAQPMSDGGWFKVIFTGALNGKTTSSVEFFLADYRDGKEFICSNWTEVDLTALGVVDQVKITFDGSDKGDYGLNTPTYVCIDDIEIEK